LPGPSSTRRRGGHAADRFVAEAIASRARDGKANAIVRQMRGFHALQVVSVRLLR
jgi:hypothetical protein